MRRLALWCCVAVLVGCEKPKEQPAADTTAAMAPAPAPGAAPISLADAAGTWTMRVMPTDADTALVTFEMEVGPDGKDWVFKFPKRKPITGRATAAGDSLLVENGPYESLLRKGVQVTTSSVMRLQDGKLVGTTIAHYSSGTDPVRTLRIEGTKKP